MLLVRGASIFKGYLGDAPTPFVEWGGKDWYKTGDLVSEDADGFITFRGRLKRFVKKGGEMVSLPAIESVLLENFPADASNGPVLAVESTPTDELVLFTTIDLDVRSANKLIMDGGLSGLHKINRVEKIEAIPVLGTGKTDYRALKDRLKE